jgi:hypothetical protein
MTLKKVLVLVLFGLAAQLVTSPGMAAASDDTAQQLQKSADVLRQLGLAGDHGIPDQVMARAKCVVVIPNMVKAAALVGGKYGRGVATCRTDQTSDDNRNERAKGSTNAHWSSGVHHSWWREHRFAARRGGKRLGHAGYE